MITCKCPAAKSLPKVPSVTCPEDFGQIQKVIFMRIMNGTEHNSFAKPSNDITSLDSWTPLLVAEDGTKVVPSPYIQAPDAPAGEARTFGGGNETLGGIEIPIGREPTIFNGVMRQIPQRIIKAMKALECESMTNNLGVFLVDENGNIGALGGSAYNVLNPDTYYPIPIRSLFISDKTLGGLESPDSNNIRFALPPNWSDDLVLVTPSFNPLTDLNVAE